MSKNDIRSSNPSNSHSKVEIKLTRPQSKPSRSSGDKSVASKIDVGLSHKISRIDTAIFKNSLKRDSLQKNSERTLNVERDGLTVEWDSKQHGKESDKRSGPIVHTFSKKVSQSWYRRYANILEPEDRVFIQPYEEIAQDELDSAMQLFYGKYYKQDYPEELADETISNEMYLKAMTYYEKTQHPSASKSDVEVEVDVLPEKEPKAPMTLGMHIKRLQLKTKAQTGNDSIRCRWLKLRASKAKSYFHKENLLVMKQLARKRFIKIINAILIINKFVSLLMEKHQSLKLTVFKIPDIHNDEQKAEEDEGATERDFNPGKYESNHNKETAGLPVPIILILTKPWFSRTIDEIGDVVKCLYPRWVYHKYPISVQLQMAHVAWYTKIDKKRPIVREGNPATRFFILLSGQIAVTELAKGKDRQYCHHGMRFVKYINKGERFGDEEMDTIDHIRFYNAYSTTTCELLGIDYSEYQESLIQHDIHEPPPPHILFISKLPFFKPLSRVVLLRSAKDEHIRVFYFCQEAVIAASLEKSDYIFVVLQGKCHTAFKQPRAAKVKSATRLHFGERNSLAKGKIDKGLEAKCKLTKELSSGLLSKTKEVISGNFMNSKLTQEFSREIRRIAQTCLSIPKETTSKKIQQIRVMKLIGIVYGHRLIHQIADELTEKMRLNETFNKGYEEEIKQIKTSAQKLQRKASRGRNQIEQMDILKIVLRRNQEIPDVLEEKMESRESYADCPIRASQIRRKSTARNERLASMTGNYSVKEEEEEEEEEDDDEEGYNFDVAQKTDVPYGYSAESRSKVDFKARNPLLREPQSNMLQKSPGQSVPVPRSRLSVTFSPPKSNAGQSRSPGSAPDSPSTASTRTSTPILQERKSQSPNVDNDGGIRKSVTIVEPAFSEPNIDRPFSPDQYSAAIMLFRKGEVIGNEYINFNDGKYRRPDTDPALISNGVEIVMVSKRFLLDRLYNHHRKMDKIRLEPKRLLDFDED